MEGAREKHMHLGGARRQPFPMYGISDGGINSVLSLAGRMLSAALPGGQRRGEGSILGSFGDLLDGD